MLSQNGKKSSGQLLILYLSVLRTNGPNKYYQLNCDMVTKQLFQSIYPYVGEIVRFTNSLTNDNIPNWELFNYLESLDFKFENLCDFRMTVQTLVKYDLLNCYFALGYPPVYNRDDYVLFDLVEYAFYLGNFNVTYDEYNRFVSVPKNASFFKDIFNTTKNTIKSVAFPTLYIKLNEIEEAKSNEYILILQKIVIKLSENFVNLKCNTNTIITALLSNPQIFLTCLDEDDAFQQKEFDYINNNTNKDKNVVNYEGKELLNMELLKDKLFNGVSFEILKEEYKEGYSDPFTLQLRISNFNDKKKKIGVEMKYISIDYGLKDGSLWDFGHYERILEDNSFVDVDVSFADIRKAKDGDRIQMVVNEGKFATLRLIREKGQWFITESIERNTYNRRLKSKIEHFEAIEEQFGITLQNFSVKVEDENSLDLYCEVLALDGKVEKSEFTIEAAIYDSENEIVYHTSLSSNDFKGFEVYHFGKIYLDITVDEISKIRIYPIR